MRIDRIRVGAYGPLAELELEGLAEQRPARRLRPERGRQVEPALVRRLDALRLLAGRARGSPGDAARRPRPRRARARAARTAARVRVERHLRARPTGRAWRGEAQEELANRPLAEVAWLERGTYLALHAFDADELRGLDAATWREIEQRLLGGASPAFLRPAAIAAQELSTAADALWRERPPRQAALGRALGAARGAARGAPRGARPGARARRGGRRARARARPSWRAPAAARRSSTGAATCTTATRPRCAPGRSSSACAARPRSSCRKPLAARVGAQPGERLEALRSELDERARELADLRAELEAAQLASRARRARAAC